MKRLQLRRADACASCGEHLDQGVTAWWDGATRTVTCIACHRDTSAPTADQALPPEPLERGTPGAGARAERVRRSAQRDERVRARHPKIGGFLLAVSDDPSSTRVWDQGAVGEEKVGAHLEAARASGLEVLHDRRMPRSRANIDHLVIAPTGVWVVDAKRYLGGKLERRDVGGWRRSDVRLYVGGRDRSSLLAGVRKQVVAVREALLAAGQDDVPVHGVLCFVDVETGWFAKPFEIDGVQVTWRKHLVAPMLDVQASAGPPDQQPPLVDPVRLQAIVSLLARAFRPTPSPGPRVG